MPASVLHLGATVFCSHGGAATPVASFRRVSLAGQPIVTISTPYAISACTLPRSPCSTGRWISGATRVLAGGAPVATRGGTSLFGQNATPLLSVGGKTRDLSCCA